MRNTLNLIIFILSVLVLNSVYCQNNWQLEKDKKGIKVFTRKTDLSDFKEFKGTIQIETDAETIISIIKDIEGMPEWGYSTETSKLLETFGDTVQIFYSASKLPWPFKNRDAVYKNVYKNDTTNNISLVEISCLPEYLDQSGETIRISYATGKWEMTEYDDKVDVTLQMLVDPGGDLPSWLVNAFIVDSPYETLSNLREIIEKKKY